MHVRNSTAADVGWLIDRLADSRFRPAPDGAGYTLCGRGEPRAVVYLEPLGPEAVELHAATDGEPGDLELISFARKLVRAISKHAKIYAKVRTANAQALRLIQGLGFTARHLVVSNRGEEFQIATLDGVSHAEG